ncbi:Arylsulfatase [hydrothermal vent metagenome]|uniref:Arylsulfatase n=1 Tax=hydrothermal vent metagenome TaxID=652676 RepID=A0A1W1DTL8_9ZZZZ
MKLKTLLLTLLLFITSVSIAAETPKYGYVTDSVEIPMRHNPMIEKSNLYFKIPSGERLEIIEVVDDGWTKVKYGNTEGWMISRYITNDITSHQKLKQLESENKLLAAENIKLNRELEINKYLKSDEFLSSSLDSCFQLYGEAMAEHRSKDKE